MLVPIPMAPTLVDIPLAPRICLHESQMLVVPVSMNGFESLLLLPAGLLMLMLLTVRLLAELLAWL